MLFERIQPDFIHEDERGCLVQLAREGYAQFNIITSKAGVERGGHYHKLNTEAFYIISGALRVCFVAGEATAEVRFARGDFFRIPPLVVHWFFFESDTVLASMYSRGVELPDGSKDMFACEASAPRQGEA